MKAEDKKKIKYCLNIVLITVICILINYFGRKLAVDNNFPIWLDMVGTIIAAYLLGPVCGAIVGASFNIMLGLIEPLALIFCITSISIGVIVGIVAKKKVFDSYFKTVAWSFIITLISTIIAIPVCYFLKDRVIGNLWGDGISSYLHEKHIPLLITLSLGVLYVEFLDKLFVFSIVYIVIHIKRKLFGQKVIEAVAAMLVMILCIGSFLPNVQAAEETRSLFDENIRPIDYDSYIQTVYNNLNGIPGGTANDVVHTGDGITWIGTYAGLYRYNGTNFKAMTGFESVKNVNRLYVDEENRLWIGTNDDGLSILVNEEISNVLDESTGLPSNSVRSIIQQSSGLYFVGTSDSMAVVSLTGGFKVINVIDDIKYAISSSADSDNHIVSVTDAGKIYVITGFEITDSYNKAKDGSAFTSSYINEAGIVYAGTAEGNIELYSIANNKLKYIETLECPQFNVINKVYNVEEHLFVCSDNGIGFFNTNNEFVEINTGSFNSNIMNMSVDYQGNIWFSSTRLGVLKLSRSPFYEIYSKTAIDAKVVNSVIEWNGAIYSGTDNGLDCISKDEMGFISDELTDLLSGIRIRCLFVDSKNQLWICTQGKGVIIAETPSKIRSYSSENGLMGDKVRCAIELSDGLMSFCGDAGVTIIDDKARKVVASFNAEKGMANSKTLCLAEGFSGEIYAGTDGGGISVFENNKFVKNITRKDGLNSGVILRLVKDEANQGMFVVTSNGICYIDSKGSIRQLNNFPYTNNYDIYDNGNGTLFVSGSAGIYVVNKENLLSGRTLDYELLNSKRGLMVNLTANAWNYVDKSGEMYLAGGNGIATFNIYDFESLNHSYRMMVKSVLIDGVSHFVDKSFVINIPRGSTTVELVPEVINYSASDPFVSYYLEGDGFDGEKKVVLQSELNSITYTNLLAGQYLFHFSVLGSDGETPIEEMVYTINIEKEYYDNTWFKYLFIMESIVIVGWLTWFITKTQIQRTLDIQKRELSLAKQQVNMGNETIIAIARTVDAKDSNTSMHSTRVSEYSVLIAKHIGYSEEECELLRKIALLHDIGKIGVPDNVLNKQGRLTDDEYEIMKSHVIKGADILKDFSLVEHVSDGALYHHERYDGKGYVHGLKGEEIPLNARIIGIADSFDAMTANRVYRKKLPPDVVLEEIRKGRGTQFDPKLTDVFLELIEKKIIDIDKIYEGGDK